MNKTLLERQPNNKRIATTESLQKRFFNGSKNHVMEIEKLICHHSATKEHINFGYTILFLNYFYFSCHKAERMPRSSIYFFDFNGFVVFACRQYVFLIQVYSLVQGCPLIYDMCNPLVRQLPQCGIPAIKRWYWEDCLEVLH